MIFILYLYLLVGVRGEKPCAARHVAGESVVCVCNETYCDDVTREAPLDGNFVTYTSSKEGSRFLRKNQNLVYLDAPSILAFTLQPKKQLQTIEGFGAAVTDSAAINWKSLSPTLQDYMINSYFSDKGLEYNMLRVPIGGTDFSVRAYAYNEYPVNDTQLTNYTLAKEDSTFKIPMIKQINSVATDDVHIVASTWSPPPWMKTNRTYVGSNQLLPEYYQTFADYHLKLTLNTRMLHAYAREKPCAARHVAGESVVCVCNETYCDDVTREAPLDGNFVTYTSSKEGSRFLRKNQNLVYFDAPSILAFTLQPKKQLQTIEGFGAAVTDSAAINWKSLSPTLQDYMINSYFSDKGLEYNMLRVPIGGTDFSVRAYAYNEYPVNDTQLTNYTLAKEDSTFKIPMIKQINSVATDDVHIVASTWSPPPWMKTNRTYVGSNQLLPEYYQTFADYHLKFLELYSNEGVPVWAITTTNEQTNGLMMPDALNCLGWIPNTMGTWIANNLGPTIRNSSFKDVKILALDDQRYYINAMFSQMVNNNPAVLDYVDGVAVHFYGDSYTSPCILSQLAKNYPDKFILATEASEGVFANENEKVKLGSWDRAVNYITNIIQDINHNVVGWMDWNICLNAEGGPTWVKNYLDSPVIVFPEKNEFVKEPMFYALGHFSKFVPRGSKRIEVSADRELDSDDLHLVSFLTPRNTLVTVVYNGGNATTVGLKLNDSQAILNLEASSITTVEQLYSL